MLFAEDEYEEWLAGIGLVSEVHIDCGECNNERLQTMISVVVEMMRN